MVVVRGGGCGAFCKPWVWGIMSCGDTGYGGSTTVLMVVLLRQAGVTAV